MPVSPGEIAVTQPRKRAAGACQSCHARKVRCSLAHTGSPCINCSLDHVVCEPRITQIRRTRPHRSSVRIRGWAPSSANMDTAPRNHIQGRHGSPFEPGTSPAPENPSHRSGSPCAVPASVANKGDGDVDVDNAETPYRPLAEHFSHYVEQRDAGALRTSNDAPECLYVPLYGDPRGVTLVADICEPQQGEKTGHVLVPRIPPRTVDSETLSYLQLRGVFDLPTPEACEMLIRAYFYYVHPFFPVVEANSFLEKFENSRDELSIHLLWSMFLAAANFVDDATLKAADFQSRKEMKRSMYIKAKTLYDAEYERSKITLIQAVLLMGFWYADTEDRTGPWHWNGVAISLCQSIGLHRNPDTSLSHVRSISVIDSRIWQQLWWSCFYREAWLSTGMGRPMRIHLAECNTKMPDMEQAEEQLESLPINLREKYLPEGMREISKLWTRLLNLTVILSNILLHQQREERELPTDTKVQHIESQIRACSTQHNENAVYKGSNLLKLYKYHFEIYVESVSLILYRPFLLPNSAELSSKDWRSTVEEKTRSAALTTNRILSGMISADMINVCQSIICIALVPTLQVHLLDYTSAKPMIKRMGYQHLELCMIVVEELKKTLFGAEILYRMFTKAQRQIRNRELHIARAAPVTPGNELSASPECSAIDLLANMSHYEYQTHEFDALSAIWNSDALMTTYEFLDNPTLL